MKKLTLRLDAYRDDARRTVAGAQQLADERKHSEVEPIHLWYELVDQCEEAQAALRECGVDPTDVIVESEWALRRIGASGTGGDAYLSTRFLELLSRAELEATRHGGRPVGTGDLVLACAQEPRGLVRSILNSVGVSSAILREALAKTNPMGSNEQAGSSEAGGGVLEEYGRDLTRLAAQGVLFGDPSAAGLVVDLGGASMELCPVNLQGPGLGVSTALGPQRLGDLSDQKGVRALIAQTLEPLARRFVGAGHRIYLVGGAWRPSAV